MFSEKITNIVGKKDTDHKESENFINFGEKLNEVLISFYTDLKCNICHELLENPVECSVCSKYFCKKCILKWGESKEIK